MPRTARLAPGGFVYHVLNRGVGRRRLFDKPADYQAFEEVVRETLAVRPMRVCAYCVLPNHWHFVLWPERDGELAAFMQRLTITHVTRWQKQRGKVGEGHLYQGRFKSFPVQTNDYFYQVVRYVERNALRAGLAAAAEAWRWGSLWCRTLGTAEQRSMLSPWPLERPRLWTKLVNAPQHESEVQAIRAAVARGRPFGTDAWIRQTAEQLGLQSTLRSRGRQRVQPRNQADSMDLLPLNPPFESPRKVFSRRATRALFVCYTLHRCQPSELGGSVKVWRAGAVKPLIVRGKSGG